MFIRIDESTFSRALVYHLLAIPLGSSTYNILAIFLDPLTIISSIIYLFEGLVTSIGVTDLISVKGTTALAIKKAGTAIQVKVVKL